MTHGLAMHILLAAGVLNLHSEHNMHGAAGFSMRMGWPAMRVASLGPLLHLFVAPAFRQTMYFGLLRGFCRGFTNLFD